MFLEDFYCAAGQTGKWKLVWKSEKGTGTFSELPGCWVFDKDRERALAKANACGVRVICLGETPR